MNRFRTKKKGKDEGGGMGRSFRRGKKAQDEPKKELDIDTALPPQDDFRTSLLMSGLSARFSLLREQDDPSTKIGKASDDSVLFANRQSRLLDYGYSNGLGPLADIAEVESIKGPPSFNRMHSFMSVDADSVQGSIMGRAKPTEGNNLFGGRQKIYKIPDGVPVGKGGMTGKALYDDDVATSAFQRWRQAEKAASLMGRGNPDTPANIGGDEGYGPRPDSPVSNGYNRKRETSSTSSSANSLGRNSTAATSVVSQPTASAKDWQWPAASMTAAASSTAPTTGPERSFTRTRRLYEQGLTHDLHEQQYSALSRIDTLSRQRNAGSRTPEVSANSPSPTMPTSTTPSGFGERFGERFGAERRQILTKASAPNLRSASPPTTGSSVGAMDLGTRAPTALDRESGFGGSPPLSPPISEPSDQLMLPIQPNDRGKATAMGVFQKPSQPYDESRFAQRQLQLQQGRETPTQRFRAESNASGLTGRSRSSSSLSRQALDNINGNKAEHPRTAQATVPEESGPGTFLDDSDAYQLPPGNFSTTRPRLQRPADSDHPAFRHHSAMPTPLSLAGRGASEEPSPISEVPDLSVHNSQQVSPEDSPTLGPGPAGLSGMVRQHLRNDSNASSVYGPAPPTAGLGPSVPQLDLGFSLVDSIGARSNPWGQQQDQDWALPSHGVGASPAKSRASTDPSLDLVGEKPPSKAPSRSSRSSHDGGGGEAEGDEFADQLANARRRVRERLISYAESDGAQAVSPMRTSEASLDGQSQSSTRPTPLGLGLLKQKSSRGSLSDRSRDLGGSQSKAMKMLGISVSTMGPSPTPATQAFDEGSATSLPAVKEDHGPSAGLDGETNPRDDGVSDGEAAAFKEDENIHPGLRAFRQARRELQRRKELETLARHQTQQAALAGQAENPAARATTAVAGGGGSELGGRQRTRSRERKPPPVLYSRARAPSQESMGSRGGSAERGRSGSETSSGLSSTRPTRLRNDSMPGRRDDYGAGPGPGHGPGPGPGPGPGHAPSHQLGPPRAGMLRSPGLSPGLPGTDIRHSPIMPPQGYPGHSGPHPAAAPSPRFFDRSGSAGNVHHHGQPSPISPLPPVSPMLGLPTSPLPGANGAPGTGANTPTGLLPSPRRPSAPPTPGLSVTASTLNESLKKVVNKADISEPTFIMSTSRVPTVALPPHSGAAGAGPGASAASSSSPDSADRQQRSRSASRTRGDFSGAAAAKAPPVPPLHPMRRQEASRTKAMLGGLAGRRADGLDEAASLSTPHLPFSSPSNNSSREDLAARHQQSSFSLSDDEDRPEKQRRRLRKQSFDAKTAGLNARAAATDRSGGAGELRDRGQSPPFVATGPPVGRSIITPMTTNPSSSAPGGMF